VRQDARTDLVLRAWNLLGGLEWAGVPIVARLLGIEDEEAIEDLVRGLVTTRDWLRRKDA
jgi:hypothetical protein